MMRSGQTDESPPNEGIPGEKGGLAKDVSAARQYSWKDSGGRKAVLPG